MLYECFYLWSDEALEASNDFNRWSNDCSHICPSRRRQFVRRMRYKSVRALQAYERYLAQELEGDDIIAFEDDDMQG